MSNWTTILRRNSILFLPALVVLFSLAGRMPAAAQALQPTPGALVSDDQVNALAKKMYCPICENTPLDVCPTQACAQWRELIREKLALGWSEQQVKDYFASQYGDRVLAEPPRRGLNWLIYILPPVAILFGAWGVFKRLRGMHRRAAAAAEPDPSGAAIDPYVQRLEEELRRRELE